jgi:phenylpyruvate tautomerase PptA (4-oxalocrotonate tautomerase family)
MPYLQLDVPAPLDAATKRGLAEAIGERYAAVMETGRHIPSICIRDAGEGGPFRYQDGALADVAVLMCDVRRGRDAAQRERLARDLVVLIARATRLPEQQIVVEFTQHEPSEMFRYGALAPEWDAAEAER